MTLFFLFHTRVPFCGSFSSVSLQPHGSLCKYSRVGSDAGVVVVVAEAKGPSFPWGGGTWMACPVCLHTCLWCDCGCAMGCVSPAGQGVGLWLYLADWLSTRFPAVTSVSRCGKVA